MHGSGNYTSYRRQSRTREEGEVRFSGIATTQFESALWQRIRYSAMREYQPEEIDFEDMKYDPVLLD